MSIFLLRLSPILSSNSSYASNYYNYFHPRRRRLSINGLHNYIKKRVAEEEDFYIKRCQIVESHHFRGRINAAEASQRGNQLYNDRVFEDILMAEGTQTHYLPLRNFSSKKEERGIDVWLSLEVFEYAMAGKIDVAVLIVSDTDYAPLLRKLCSLGVRTMLLSWEFEYTNDDNMRVVTKTSHELLQLATYPIAMHEEIETGMEAEDPFVFNLFVDSDYPRDEEIKRQDSRPRETSEILSIKNGFGFVKYPNNNSISICRTLSATSLNSLPEIRWNSSSTGTCRNRTWPKMYASSRRTFNSGYSDNTPLI